MIDFVVDYFGKNIEWVVDNWNIVGRGSDCYTVGSWDDKWWDWMVAVDWIRDVCTNHWHKDKSVTSEILSN